MKILWADAACINQSDDQERGHQVKQMGSIYATATKVLIWLGTNPFGYSSEEELVKPLILASMSKSQRC